MSFYVCTTEQALGSRQPIHAPIACACNDQYHLCRMWTVYTESFNLLLTFSQIQFCFVTIILKNYLPHFWRTYHISCKYFESVLHFNDKTWTYSSGWFISISTFLWVLSDADKTRCLMCAITPKNTRSETQTTLTLPVVWYECETWSPTLRKKHRVWVFDKRMLSKIFGLKWEEVKGDWRKVHNEDLHDL